MIDKKNIILVTGASGMLGHHLVSNLKKEGYLNILQPTQEELDLFKYLEVEKYIKEHKPDFVFHLAGLVYGLGGNLKNQVEAIYKNSLINLNLLYSLKDSTVKKVFFAGTVASYPFPYKELPLQEEQMFLGRPHAGEYGYAVAKTLGYNFLEILKKEIGIDYCIGLFTNMFGEFDNFNLETGHVVPSLIYKIYLAKRDDTSLQVWGKDMTTRDFLYADDAAKATILTMNNFSGMINISTGKETNLKELIEVLSSVANFDGETVWDKNAPIGIEKRSVNNSKLKNLGFTDFIDLKTALSVTYDWFVKEQNK